VVHVIILVPGITLECAGAGAGGSIWLTAQNIILTGSSPVMQALGYPGDPTSSTYTTSAAGSIKYPGMSYSTLPISANGSSGSSIHKKVPSRSLAVAAAE